MGSQSLNTYSHQQYNSKNASSWTIKSDNKTIKNFVSMIKHLLTTGRVHCDTNEEINCETKTNSLHAVNSTCNQLENPNCIKWNLHEPIYHIQSTETQKQMALMVQSLTKNAT